MMVAIVIVASRVVVIDVMVVMMKGYCLMLVIQGVVSRKVM